MAARRLEPRRHAAWPPARPAARARGRMRRPPPISGVHSKTLASLRPLLAELERFYVWANRAFFGSRLSERVIITVAPGGRRRAPGSFAPLRWQETRQPANRPHEIVLAAECLHLPPIEILHILLREMIHLANAEAGLRDHDPLRRYSNGHFKRGAEARGLQVARDGRRGWGRTILSPDTRRLILEDFRPDPTRFTAFRPDLDRPQGRNKYRLWECACPMKARVVTAGFRDWCEWCGARFVLIGRGSR